MQEKSELNWSASPTPKKRKESDGTLILFIRREGEGGHLFLFENIFIRKNFIARVRNEMHLTFQEMHYGYTIPPANRKCRRMNL